MIRPTQTSLKLSKITMNPEVQGGKLDSFVSLSFFSRVVYDVFAE